jgi:hypothetical protein
MNCELNFANFLIVTGLYSTLKVSQWKRRNSLCIYWRVVSGGVWTVFACSGKSCSDCAIKKNSAKTHWSNLHPVCEIFKGQQWNHKRLFILLFKLDQFMFKKKGNGALLFKFRFSRPLIISHDIVHLFFSLIWDRCLTVALAASSKACRRFWPERAEHSTNAFAFICLLMALPSAVLTWKF